MLIVRNCFVRPMAYHSIVLRVFKEALVASCRLTEFENAAIGGTDRTCNPRP
jgi:hypothetical protein